MLIDDTTLPNKIASLGYTVIFTAFDVLYTWIPRARYGVERSFQRSGKRVARRPTQINIKACTAAGKRRGSRV